MRLQGGCGASKGAGWGGAPDGAGLSRSLEALSRGGGTPKADSNSVPLAVAARFVCPPNRPFRCKNDRVCLWIGRQCDGTDNCGDGTDEEDCGEQGASEGGSGGRLEWGCCTHWAERLVAGTGRQGRPLICCALRFAPSKRQFPAALVKTSLI